MSARRSYLKTGDSGTRRERRRARRGTRGQREEICHHLSWVPRLMMRRLPTHLRTLSSMEKVPLSSGLQISTVKMLVLTIPLLTPTRILTSEDIVTV